MKKFFERVSRLIDRMIDADSLIPPKGRMRPVQIKVIFDNLRYYPLLAFLWIGVRILKEDGTWLSSFGSVVLGFVVTGFGTLVALQTWAITLVTVLTILSSLLPPRRAVVFRRRVRSNSNWVKLAALLLIGPLVFATWGVAIALFAALSRANLL